MLIVHRCTNCNQPDIWCQGDPTDGTVATRRCCGGARWGPPELMPRWRNSDQQPITRVLKPGGKTETISVTSCICDACKALYDADGVAA